MIAPANNATGGIRRAVPLRHAAGLIATVAFNGALIFALIAWSGRNRPRPRAVVRAVPLNVVPAEPPPVELALPDAPAPPAPTPPMPAPALPALPAPTLPAVAPALPAPTPIELAVEAALPVPVYAAEFAPAAPAPAIAPVPRPATAPPATTLGKPSDTHGPMLVSRPSLSDYYPRRALLRGVTGRTTVRLQIDSAGAVTSVAVVASQPAGVFEHAAGRVGRVLRFRPAERQGKNVPAVVTLDIVWRVE